MFKLKNNAPYVVGGNFALWAATLVVLSATTLNAGCSAHGVNENTGKTEKTEKNEKTRAKKVSTIQHASPEYLAEVHAEIKAHHYKRAMEMLEVKANQGCSYSQSLLGLMHQKGLGCRADAKEASHWFMMAAKKDFADAQFQLGKLYSLASRDLAPEANQARYWLTRAADSGVAEARSLIGHVPGGSELAYKVTEMRNNTAAAASQSEAGLTKSWTGYADIVNTLNGAGGAVNQTGNN